MDDSARHLVTGGIVVFGLASLAVTVFVYRLGGALGMSRLDRALAVAPSAAFWSWDLVHVVTHVKLPVWLNWGAAVVLALMYAVFVVRQVAAGLRDRRRDTGEARCGTVRIVITRR
jgi:hypothetical protein